MSRNLLEKILDDIQITTNKNLLIEFLCSYKLNEYIYPSVISRKFKLPNEEIYKILTELEKSKIIKMYYEIYCLNCNHSNALVPFYNKIFDYTECDSCSEKLTVENVKVVYKVINNE